MNYEEIKALNWSTLKHVATSPLLYKWRIDHPEPPKPAYLIGSAIHCKILEPSKFDKRYALCEVRRNKRDRAYQDWLAAHPDAEPLKADELADIEAAAASVASHPVASKILNGCRHEDPAVWTDPVTGIECKGRIDAIKASEYIVDLKSTRDAGHFRFARAAAEYLYYGQLAYYQTGAVVTRKISGDVMPYIIAVESGEPYDVAVYQLKPDDLELGRNLCLDLMRKLAECQAADYWPGKAPDLAYLDLPPWALGGSPDGSEEF